MQLSACSAINVKIQVRELIIPEVCTAFVPIAGKVEIPGNNLAAQLALQAFTQSPLQAFYMERDAEEVNTVKDRAPASLQTFYLQVCHRL